MFIGEHPQRDGRDGEHGSLESGTRARVLQLVSTDGPITAAELGRELGLTAAAVRRHLDGLVEAGTVVEHEAVATGTRGRGRPARAYVLSEAGHGSLEADYGSLAVEVLQYLEDNVGPAAVADFARSRVAALEERYAGELAQITDPHERTERLVALLSADGFSASARPVGTGGLAGIQLCQGHCPVHDAAQEFPQFCEAETDAFSRLLGVHVQRLATLAGGDHVCTTFVPTTVIPVSDVLTTPVSGGPHSGTPRHTTSTHDTTDERSRP